MLTGSGFWGIVSGKIGCKLKIESRQGAKGHKERNFRQDRRINADLMFHGRAPLAQTGNKGILGFE